MFRYSIEMIDYIISISSMFDQGVMIDYTVSAAWGQGRSLVLVFDRWVALGTCGVC